MITVYTTKSCRYCPMVKMYLSKLGADYRVVDCTDDISLAQPAIDLSGAFSFPQTVSGDRVVVGYNANKLKELV